MVAPASDGRIPAATPATGQIARSSGRQATARDLQSQRSRLCRAQRAEGHAKQRSTAKVGLPATRPLESAVWAALQDVHDPEIPTISVVDLGIVRSVEAEEGSVRVQLLPTFIGCPAIEVMRSSVQERLREFADDVAVEITFAEPWTTDRITPDGRAALRAAGFAGPAVAGPDSRELSVVPILPIAECPYCGSRNTRLENAFGPTLCRAIYHCSNCRQPFEQFKEV